MWDVVEALGICLFIYFHVPLCTGNEQMMKLACEGSGGGAPLGICSFVCEGWRGALRDLFIYVILLLVGVFYVLVMCASGCA